jgi:hypothetical protein
MTNPTNPQEAIAAQTIVWRADLKEILRRLNQGSVLDFTGVRAPDHPVRPSKERHLAIVAVQQAIIWLDMDEEKQKQPNDKLTDGGRKTHE